MDTTALAAFISGYTEVLTHAWSSDEFVDRLMAQPQAVLAEHGLATVVGAQVTILRTRDGAPDLQAQVALWEQGHATGDYALYVPTTPQLSTAELTDVDLEAVSGGGDGCCCCNPCCCDG